MPHRWRKRDTLYLGTAAHIDIFRFIYLLWGRKVSGRVLAVCQGALVFFRENRVYLIREIIPLPEASGERDYSMK